MRYDLRRRHHSDSEHSGRVQSKTSLGRGNTMAPRQTRDFPAGMAERLKAAGALLRQSGLAFTEGGGEDARLARACRKLSKSEKFFLEASEAISDGRPEEAKKGIRSAAKALHDAAQGFKDGGMPDFAYGLHQAAQTLHCSVEMEAKQEKFNPIVILFGDAAMLLKFTAALYLSDLHFLARQRLIQAAEELGKIGDPEKEREKLYSS